MNELTPGLLNLTALAVAVGGLVIGLVLWFFVNRASVRANKQIDLLEDLLAQQKRQNALLRRLCEANEPEQQDDVVADSGQADGQDNDLVRLVAER